MTSTAMRLATLSALVAFCPMAAAIGLSSGAAEALLTGDLPAAPNELLFPAIFSKRERNIIAADPALSAAIQARPPIAWRAVFEAHRVMRCPAPRRLEAGAAAQMRRYAVAALNAEADSLAQLTDGRRDAVFRSACRLAKFAAHNVLSAARNCRCTAHGLGCERRSCKSMAGSLPGDAIARGIALGRNDALPVLDAGHDHTHSIGGGS